MLGEAVYALAAITSLICALLLLRAWRRDGIRLLLWAGVCFIILFVQNVLLFTDLVVLGPQINLSLARTAIGAVGIVSLLYGILSDDL